MSARCYLGCVVTAHNKCAGFGRVNHFTYLQRSTTEQSDVESASSEQALYDQGEPNVVSSPKTES